MQNPESGHKDRDRTGTFGRQPTPVQDSNLDYIATRFWQVMIAVFLYLIWQDLNAIVVLYR